ELKGEKSVIPVEAFEAIGYRAAINGQKTYNGVAILSRKEITDVERGMDDGVDDPQARLIAGTIAGGRLVSVYVPNGQTVGSEKYAYKTAWLERFAAWLEPRLRDGRPTVVCGDFNIARDERDVDDPKEWEGTVLYNDEIRAALGRLLDLGLIDAFRLHNEEGGLFSWWDYRQNSFRRNRGLRIDYVLVTEDLAHLCTDCVIDREERAGEKPSDHAPVIAEFDL
ncbi:MAG: exodeoxyribonuclease III, partial [Deltaproteobacteria bacterium]|nr:exodeoxyribonuclease III [Deltaproteobacteria bacterium]